MKFLLSYILLFFVASSCGRNSNRPLSDANHIVVDSLSGYSISVYSASIQVHRDQRFVCSALIFSADSQYLHMAKQLDSLDTARGFIFARALEGPELAEPPGCDLKYSIDSAYEYHNKFNVRCFFIRLTGIQTCDDGHTNTVTLSRIFYRHFARSGLQTNRNSRRSW